MHGRREQIRPRLVDLAEIDESDEGGNLMGWPAAASADRRAAPEIKGKEDVHEQTGQAREEAPAAVEDAASAAAEAPRRSVLGQIHERDGLAHAATQRRGEASKSRFRAMREMDREAGVAETTGTKPVSAFMRSRMTRKEGGMPGHGMGQVPKQAGPAERPPDGEAAAASRDMEHQREAWDADARAPTLHKNPSAATRDPGGGAPPDQISELLRAASEENQRKLTQMSYDSVEDKLGDAIAFFGRDTLQKLQARRSTAGKPDPNVEDEPMLDAPAPAQAGSSSGWPSLERRLSDPGESSGTQARTRPAPGTDTQELETMRSRYFPEEPETVNPSLEWIAGTSKSQTQPRARFDFNGHTISRPLSNAGRAAAQMSDTTFLSGLHHHGDDQETPGYSIDELLHLARSAAPSQRALAAQVLGRVCARNPQHLGGACGVSCGTFFADGFDLDMFESLDANASALRAQILLTAFWLLEDRNRSVRAAALECLGSAVQSVSVLGAALARTVQSSLSVTAAAPYMDWIWLASLPEESATKPRVAPPTFNADEASYLELVQRNWADALVKFGAMHRLEQVLAADAQASNQQHTLQLLYLLVEQSADAASSLPQHPALVQLVVRQGCTAYAWPLASEERQWPSENAVRVLLRAIQSSRDAAAALVADGAVDPFLRTIIVAPTSVDSSEYEHRLLALSLDIVTALARYGLNSGSLRELWASLQSLCRWAVGVLQSEACGAATLQCVRCLFLLLDTWTQAAVEQPRHGDLGINWPSVSGWIHFGADALAAAKPSADPLYMATVGAALRYVASWHAVAQGFAAKQMQSSNAFLAGGEDVAWHKLLPDSLVKMAENTTAVVSEANAHLASALPQRHDAVAQTFGALFFVCEFLEAYASASCADLPLEMGAQGVWAAQTQLQSAAFLDILASPISTCTGAVCLRPTVLAACIAGHAACGTVKDRRQIYAVLPDLGPEDSTVFERLLRRCVQALDPTAWSILSPFLLENARAPQNGAAPASMMDALGHTDAKHVSALLVSDPLRALVVRAPAEEDPITEGVFWSCVAARLPVRKDWAFSAIDDLLHSGEARVFNSAGILPKDWDYSEGDIVRATLQLGSRVVYEQLSSSTADSRQLPSASLIWLDIMKIFLLEEDQAASGKYSGKATGKDLYTNPAIEASLQDLMTCCNQLAAVPHLQPVSLEDAARDINGESVSFYQTYTDLVGLYDAVSFGNEFFATALCPPLAMMYACDYRRLLWCDYYATLQSIRLGEKDVPAAPRIGSAPLPKIHGYLWPLEQDAQVLSAYVKALATQHVTAEAQPLLCRIALHHVSGAIFASDEPSEWEGYASTPQMHSAARKTIFSAETPTSVQQAVLQYFPSGQGTEERVAERTAALARS